jgi:hypothetical protein
MLVKVQAKLHPRTPDQAWRQDYPLRVSPFFLSFISHCLAIATLTLVTFPGGSRERPVYEELIKPHEHQILFYDFLKKVPDVTPVKKVGSAPDPRGVELSEQAIIASSRKPKSKQMLILVPAPKIEIHEDLPAPLLVARLNLALPPGPARPKPKSFVPPQPPKPEPKLPIPTPILDAQAVPVISLMVAPPLATDAPTSPIGDAPADIAVASLHPSQKADDLVPNGERPGRFSKAPIQGAAASGDANASAALTAPDLTIRHPKQERTAVTPTRAVLYAERVRNIPLSTLSAPLRPASRMIPQEVDTRFRGRNVYTIVIPMENMLGYAGDWIIWFADRKSKPGETPVVRAPVPFRKLEAVDQPPPSDRTRDRIQLAATLTTNGRLDGITLLSKTDIAMQDTVFQDLTSWEFRPAMRDGAPVDVDVILEIPFNLPTAVARSAQP